MKQESDDKYILMTYKSHIVKKMETTYYDSDSGWGCMLRVGQMAIANYLYKYERLPFKTILAIFWDNSNLPFSIQSFTKESAKLFPHKKQYEWYNPCEMGFLIKQLIAPVLPQINTKIFLDNSIFLSEIPTDKPKLLIMIMIRIGLQEPEPEYLPVIKSLINSGFFYAALGGTPKHAHLFLKIKDNKIGYLDPHKTTKAPSNEQQLLKRQNQFISELSWIKLNKIDSSMALVFSLKKAEIQIFWNQLQSIKQAHKQNFFLYMDKQRPEIDDSNLIEIIDF